MNNVYEYIEKEIEDFFSKETTIFKFEKNKWLVFLYKSNFWVNINFPKLGDFRVVKLVFKIYDKEYIDIEITARNMQSLEKHLKETLKRINEGR